MIEKVKKILSDKIRKYKEKKSKRIVLKSNYDTYGFRYAIPVGLFIGFTIDKTLIVKTKGLYALVPFSFAIYLMNKFRIRFTSNKKIKHMNMFRDKRLISF